MSSAFPDLVDVIEGIAHGDRLSVKSRQILDDAAQSWPAFQLDGLTVDDVEVICGSRYGTVHEAARVILDHVEQS